MEGSYLFVLSCYFKYTVILGVDYNDHHFHFGYFVYAAAVLAKERPDFVQTYGSAIINLIRDYSNPALDNNDPHFTFMRNKDWFVGDF